MIRALSFLVVAALVLATGSEAKSSVIVLNETKAQTVGGEDFNFIFTPIAAADGTGGTLTIHARGDYDPSTSTEFLTWDIDSLGIGGAAGPTIGGVTIIQNNGINDVEWSQSFAISGLNMLTITSDFLASILVDLNGDDTSGVGHGFQPNEFVEVTVTYNSAAASTVPEPASLTLVGLGAFGLFAGAIRRRRWQQAAV